MLLLAQKKYSPGARAKELDSSALSQATLASLRVVKAFAQEDRDAT